VPDATHVRVEGALTRQTICIYAPAWNPSTVTICSPESVGRFVDAYDKSLPVAPFSFDIEIPDFE